MNWKQKDTTGLKKKTEIKMSVITENTDLSLKYTAHYNEVKELLFNGSSEILNAQRNKAFRNFVERGIPNRKVEDYKYTNLHPRFAPDKQFSHVAEETDAELKAIYS